MKNIGYPEYHEELQIELYIAFFIILMMLVIMIALWMERGKENEV